MTSLFRFAALLSCFSVFAQSAVLLDTSNDKSSTLSTASSVAIDSTVTVYQAFQTGNTASSLTTIELGCVGTGGTLSWIVQLLDSKKTVIATGSVPKNYEVGSSLTFVPVTFTDVSLTANTIYSIGVTETTVSEASWVQSTSNVTGTSGASVSDVSSVTNGTTTSITGYMVFQVNGVVSVAPSATPTGTPTAAAVSPSASASAKPVTPSVLLDTSNGKSSTLSTSSSVNIDSTVTVYQAFQTGNTASSLTTIELGCVGTGGTLSWIVQLLDSKKTVIATGSVPKNYEVGSSLTFVPVTFTDVSLTANTIYSIGVTETTVSEASWVQSTSNVTGTSGASVSDVSRVTNGTTTSISGYMVFQVNGVVSVAPSATPSPAASVFVEVSSKASVAASVAANSSSGAVTASPSASASTNAKPVTPSVLLDTSNGKSSRLSASTSVNIDDTVTVYQAFQTGNAASTVTTIELGCVSTSGLPISWIVQLLDSKKTVIATGSVPKNYEVGSSLSYVPVTFTDVSLTANTIYSIGVTETTVSGASWVQSTSNVTGSYGASSSSLTVTRLLDGTTSSISGYMVFQINGVVSEAPSATPSPAASVFVEVSSKASVAASVAANSSSGAVTASPSASASTNAKPVTPSVLLDTSDGKSSRLPTSSSVNIDSTRTTYQAFQTGNAASTVTTIELGCVSTSGLPISWIVQLLDSKKTVIATGSVPKNYEVGSSLSYVPVTFTDVSLTANTIYSIGVTETTASRASWIKSTSNVTGSYDTSLSSLTLSRVTNGTTSSISGYMVFQINGVVSEAPSATPSASSSSSPKVARPSTPATTPSSSPSASSSSVVLIDTTNNLAEFVVDPFGGSDVSGVLIDAAEYFQFFKATSTVMVTELSIPVRSSNPDVSVGVNWFVSIYTLDSRGNPFLKIEKSQSTFGSRASASGAGSYITVQFPTGVYLDADTTYALAIQDNINVKSTYNQAQWLSAAAPLSIKGTFAKDNTEANLIVKKGESGLFTTLTGVQGFLIKGSPAKASSSPLPPGASQSVTPSRTPSGTPSVTPSASVIPVVGEVAVSFTLPGDDPAAAASNPTLICTTREALADVAGVSISDVKVDAISNVETGERVELNYTADNDPCVSNNSSSRRRMLRSLAGSSLTIDVVINVTESTLANTSSFGNSNNNNAPVVSINIEALVSQAIAEVFSDPVVLNQVLGPIVQAACSAAGLNSCPDPSDVVVVKTLTYSPPEVVNTPVTETPAAENRTPLIVGLVVGLGGGLLAIAGVFYLLKVYLPGLAAANAAKAAAASKMNGDAVSLVLRNPVAK